MIDKKAIEDHIRGILIALGDDPSREGLRDTPSRVANMYEEVFEGMAYTNDELIEKLANGAGELIAQGGLARHLLLDRGNPFDHGGMLAVETPADVDRKSVV